MSVEFDAFTAGVKPGGLRSKQDIKLLICYLLSSIPQGLSKEDLLSVLQDNDLANYFEVANAFDELLRQENLIGVPESDSLYTVTDSGRMIARQLDVSLPISVREQVLKAALNLLARQQLERENSAFIHKTKQGYEVEGHVSGGDMDFFSFSLYVPDSMQAHLVKHNFQRDPQLVYSCMLAALTQNKEMIQELFQELS